VIEYLQHQAASKQEPRGPTLSQTSMKSTTMASRHLQDDKSGPASLLSGKKRASIVSVNDNDINDNHTPVTTNGCSPRNKGLVKFPSKKEKMEEIRRRSSISDEQLESLWLNYQEFCSLRREVSEEISANKDRGYSKLLIGTLDEQLAQVKLDMWVKPDDNLNQRGLERHVNSQHRAWRDGEKNRAVQAVLEAQAIAREEAELDDFADSLASISNQHTQQSKEFAQMMAKADEKAVQQRRAA
jgi:DNA-binding ferritin-like protein